MKDYATLYVSNKNEEDIAKMAALIMETENACSNVLTCEGYDRLNIAGVFDAMIGV